MNDKDHRSSQIYESLAYDEQTEKTEPHQIQGAALAHQNHSLRVENERLSHNLQELTARLEVELNRKAIASDHLSFVRMENEYLNCQKLLSLYKRQIKSLKRKVLEQPQSHIEALEATIKEKDREIDILKSEVRGLKRLNQYQQKGLVQAAGDGIIECFKDYETLQEDYRKLQKRCEEYEKQLRKKTMSSKVIEVHSSDDMQRLETYEKQLEMLKLLDVKNKKLLFSNSKELERLKAERDKLADDLKEKDKEVQRCNLRIMEMRRFVQPKRVTEVALQESSYHRSRRHHTLPAEESEHQSVSPSSKHPQPQQEVRRPIRSYKQTYPKTEYRGQSNATSRVWNDSKLSSRIMQVHIALDSNNKIEEVHCRYEKGEPEHLLPDRTYNSFRCREGEFIHLISGGFSDGVLEFLVFITNEKRKVKFGVESTTAVKFDFNIQDEEYPCALFGEVASHEDGYRINKLGSLIQHQ